MYTLHRNFVAWCSSSVKLTERSAAVFQNADVFKHHPPTLNRPMQAHCIRHMLTMLLKQRYQKKNRSHNARSP